MISRCISRLPSGRGTAAKPQSTPALRFSRPTMFAQRTTRSATSSGCSTKCVVSETIPGMRILPSGELEVFPEVMLVFVAGVRVFEGVSSGFDLEKDIGYVLEWHVMDAGADID